MHIFCIIFLLQQAFGQKNKKKIRMKYNISLIKIKFFFSHSFTKDDNYKEIVKC